MQPPFAYLIGLLSAIHFSAGLSEDTHTDPCVSKILSCDWYRQPFSLHGDEQIGMFPTIGDLQKACKDQVAYIKCMRRTEDFCKKTSLSHSAEEMIRDRRFSADMCHPASPWQQLYLNEASCVNTYSNRDFSYCSSKIIGLEYMNLENIFELGCKYGRAIIDCSAARVQEKCGYYAGIILKKYLKFHSLSDYKCMDFKDVEEDSATEAIIYMFESAEFDDKVMLGKGRMKNLNLGEEKFDHLENRIPFTRDADTKVNFDNEFLTKAEDSTQETDLPEFPALPKYDYVHKNRTTFVLYEDLEMGYARYIGCGEADFFWIIKSPLRNKYCILMDLKSEYSEGPFKCTIHIDATCSPELDDEDRNRNAEVFHRRYVATVLTPPNNQLSQDMAVMNMHYLKVYPSASTLAPEKKVDLWTQQANMGAIEQAEPVSRKGSLDSEDDHSILYQHGNGSGQKRDAISQKHPHSDEYEYYEDYEFVVEDNDLYFPALFRNDVIYIEDEEGDIISLRDHRSPIYSNSLYQPNSLFRPRVGGMPESTNLRDLDGAATNLENKLTQSSFFKERVLELEDEESFSKLKKDQQEYCSAGEPCPTNSERLNSGIKLGMHIDTRNIKIFDPLQGMKVKATPKTPSMKLNTGTTVNLNSDPCERYNVRPSTRIQMPKYAEFVTDHPTHLPVGEIYDDMDITGVPRYSDSFSGSIPTSAPNFDSTTDSMELYDKLSYEFTPSQYIFRKSTNTEIHPKMTIGREILKAQPSWERYLSKIFGTASKSLLKTLEKPFNRKLLDIIISKILERPARGS